MVTKTPSTNDDSSKIQIKGILFDMDGTLLDTESLSDKALLFAFGPSLPRRILEEVSPMCRASNYRLPWELKKQLLGLRGAEWAPIALSYAKQHWGVTDDMNPPSPHELWKNWEISLNEMCEEITACKGALELVEALATISSSSSSTTTMTTPSSSTEHGVSSLPMAIATSSRYAAVEKKKKRHERMFSYIETIVAGDDAAVKDGKPAPDIYLEAAKRLNNGTGVPPSQCLVFEDALSGVRSAKAAGCYVVAIPDTRYSKEEKAVFHDEADMVLSDLSQFQGHRFGLDIDMTKTTTGTSGTSLV